MLLTQSVLQNLEIKNSVKSKFESSTKNKIEVKKMDEWIRRMQKVDGYVKDALKYAYSNKDTKEHQERFAKLCQTVLDENDPYIACYFASDVSHLLKGTYAKLFNVQKFQNLVMQADDDEVIYKFARDVKGADVKRVIDRLPNGYARQELKNMLKPINEEISF